MVVTGENQSIGRKTYPTATLPTKPLTWTDARSNPCSHGDRPAPDLLCHGRTPNLQTSARHTSDWHTWAHKNTPNSEKLMPVQYSVQKNWTALHKTVRCFNLGLDGIWENKTTREIRHKKNHISGGRVSRMAIGVTRRGRDICARAGMRHVTEHHLTISLPFLRSKLHCIDN